MRLEADPVETLRRATAEALHEREKSLSQVARERNELNAELVAARAKLAEMATLKTRLTALDNSVVWRVLQGWISMRQHYLDRIPGVKRILAWGRLAVVGRNRQDQADTRGQRLTPAETQITTSTNGRPIASKRVPAHVRRSSLSVNAPSLGSRVSVIVPTLNPGNDLPILLKALRSQQRVDAPEIIVVDSGSTDGTADIATGYGARVITIRPEEFSHSFARNIGAAKAQGEYLLFMVQDARPASRSWLYELLYTLTSTDDTAAVSCAELPTEDCDLFYRIQIWDHNRFLDIDGIDRIMSTSRGADYVTLRKNAQLSNVACLVRADVFRKYGFRGSYAEDLDLGIRLLRDGYKLALLGTTRVIHSHTRPPSYFLKRCYVDSRFLSAKFPDFPRARVDGQELAADIMVTLGRLRDIVDRLPLVRPGAAPEQLFHVARGPLEDSHAGSSIAVHYDLSTLSAGGLDEPCVVLLSSILDVFPPNGMVRNSILCKALLNAIRTYEEYVRLTYERVDDELLHQFREALFKIFALQCGVRLAFCMENCELADSRAAALHAALVAGV